ncbi:hypothetical protein Ahy_A03g015367 isoform A [Arachis hypogaea]|uniref:Uncharacterized protein n=1 Tax=Arachis hypogaea TaxID=3818 RepID=A0A445E0A2_ARAHY|nr:hypothetical protein Ahy_A03g015367 isoform A [Arachis hypogaea]
MGCCISKSQTQNQNPYHQKQYLTPSLPNSNLNQQIPQRQPPPVLEEESVKEVLNRTPFCLLFKTLMTKSNQRTHIPFPTPLSSTKKKVKSQR